MIRPERIAALSLALLAGAAAVAAQDVAGDVREIVIDATSDAGFALVNLATGAVHAPDAGESPADWQLGVRRYSLQLREGVTAALVRDNTVQAAMNAAGLTAADQLEVFRKMSVSDIPAEDQFTRTLPSSIAVDDSPPFLYGVDPGNPHAVLPSFNIYMVKDGDTVYKVQFLSYYHPLNGTARMISLRTAPVK